MYNNSGWHHRHFIITHSKGWSEDAVAAEIAFTFDKIRQAPANESGWNYLLGCAQTLCSPRAPELCVADCRLQPRMSPPSKARCAK